MTAHVYLPDPDDQQWLLERLAELIAKAGVETFLTAPIVEPSNEFFPDVWEPTAAGVEQMARRLLVLADLPSLDAQVELFEGETGTTEQRPTVGGMATSTHSAGAAAWFAGIKNSVCLFGADANQLRDPERLVGIMAHETAHAWREHHRLAVKGEDEELLTDLTTVYLGFGILTANGAYQFRKSGETVGYETHTRWSHERPGYLPPQAMCFLLAAQAGARRLGWFARRRIAGMLEANQAVYFKKACAALPASDVANRLRLPHATTTTS